MRICRYHYLRSGVEHIFDFVFCSERSNFEFNHQIIILPQLSDNQFTFTCPPLQVQFDINIPDPVLFFDAKPLPMIRPEEVCTHFKKMCTEKVEILILEIFNVDS